MLACPVRTESGQRPGHDLVYQRTRQRPEVRLPNSVGVREGILDSARSQSTISDDRRWMRRPEADHCQGLQPTVCASGG